MKACALSLGLYIVIVFMEVLTSQALLAEESNPEWRSQSASGMFSVWLKPREARVPVGRFHEWLLTVRDAQGQPVYPARIAVGGGMPGHGHGMPSQPQVTKHLGDGIYLVEGVKFNMAGEWLMLFAIDTPSGSDRVQVTVTIDH